MYNLVYLQYCLCSGEGVLPSNSSSLAILPATIDTPANRAAMPDVDTR